MDEPIKVSVDVDAELGQLLTGNLSATIRKLLSGLKLPIVEIDGAFKIDPKMAIDQTATKRMRAQLDAFHKMVNAELERRNEGTSYQRETTRLISKHGEAFKTSFGTVLEKADERLLVTLKSAYEKVGQLVSSISELAYTDGKGAKSAMQKMEKGKILSQNEIKAIEEYRRHMELVLGQYNALLRDLAKYRGESVSVKVRDGDVVKNKTMRTLPIQLDNKTATDLASGIKILGQVTAESQKLIGLGAKPGRSAQEFKDQLRQEDVIRKQMESEKREREQELKRQQNAAAQLDRKIEAEKRAKAPEEAKLRYDLAEFRDLKEGGDANLKAASLAKLLDYRNALSNDNRIISGSEMRARGPYGSVTVESQRLQNIISENVKDIALIDNEISNLKRAVITAAKAAQGLGKTSERAMEAAGKRITYTLDQRRNNRNTVGQLLSGDFDPKNPLTVAAADSALGYLNARRQRALELLASGKVSGSRAELVQGIYGKMTGQADEFKELRKASLPYLNGKAALDELKDLEKKAKELERAFAKAATEKEKLVGSSNIEGNRLNRGASARDLINAVGGAGGLTMEQARMAMAGLGEERLALRERLKVEEKKGVGTVGVQAATDNLSKNANDIHMVKQRLNELEVSTTRAKTAMGQFSEVARMFVRYGVFYQFFYTMLTGIRSLIGGVVDLEAKLKSIQAVSGSTASQMIGVAESIKDVAQSTKFSIDEVAGATQTLVQAGVNTGEIDKVLRSTANFAAATETSLQTAADLMTSLRDVYKDVSDARIADQLTKTINVSKLTGESLQTIVSLGAQVSSTYGMKQEQFLSAAAVLRNAGLKDSTVGTGLRQAILEIFSPDAKTLKALKARYKQLGETMTEATITQRFEGFKSSDSPLVSAIKELKRLGFDGSGATAFSRVFDIRAENAIKALVTNLKDLEATETRIAFGNSALVASSTQMEALKNQVDNLNGALTTLADALISDFLPGVSSGVKELTESVTGLTDLSRQLKTDTGAGLSPAVFASIFTGISAARFAGPNILSKTAAFSAGTGAGIAAGVGGAAAGNAVGGTVGAIAGEILAQFATSVALGSLARRAAKTKAEVSGDPNALKHNDGKDVSDFGGLISGFTSLVSIVAPWGKKVRDHLSVTRAVFATDGFFASAGKFLSFLLPGGMVVKGLMLTATAVAAGFALFGKRGAEGTRQQINDAKAESQRSVSDVQKVREMFGNYSTNSAGGTTAGTFLEKLEEFRQLQDSYNFNTDKLLGSRSLAEDPAVSAALDKLGTEGADKGNTALRKKLIDNVNTALKAAGYTGAMLDEDTKFLDEVAQQRSQILATAKGVREDLAQQVKVIKEKIDTGTIDTSLPEVAAVEQMLKDGTFDRLIDNSNVMGPQQLMNLLGPKSPFRSAINKAMESSLKKATDKTVLEVKKATEAINEGVYKGVLTKAEGREQLKLELGKLQAAGINLQKFLADFIRSETEALSDNFSLTISGNERRRRKSNLDIYKEELDRAKDEAAKEKAKSRQEVTQKFFIGEQNITEAINKGLFSPAESAQAKAQITLLRNGVQGNGADAMSTIYGRYGRFNDATLAFDTGAGGAFFEKMAEKAASLINAQAVSAAAVKEFDSTAGLKDQLSDLTLSLDRLNKEYEINNTSLRGTDTNQQRTIPEIFSTLKSIADIQYKIKAAEANNALKSGKITDPVLAQKQYESAMAEARSEREKAYTAAAFEAGSKDSPELKDMAKRTGVSNVYSDKVKTTKEKALSLSKEINSMELEAIKLRQQSVSLSDDEVTALAEKVSLKKTELDAEIKGYEIDKEKLQNELAATNSESTRGAIANLERTIELKRQALDTTAAEYEYTLRMDLLLAKRQSYEEANVGTYAKVKAAGGMESLSKLKNFQESDLANLKDQYATESNQADQYRIDVLTGVGGEESVKKLAQSEKNLSSLQYQIAEAEVGLRNTKASMGDLTAQAEVFKSIIVDTDWSAEISQIDGGFASVGKTLKGGVVDTISQIGDAFAEVFVNTGKLGDEFDKKVKDIVKSALKQLQMYLVKLAFVQAMSGVVGAIGGSGAGDWVMKAFGMGRARGGMIEGDGSPTSDSIYGYVIGPDGKVRKGIRVSNKESILNAKVTAELGREGIDALNSKGIKALVADKQVGHTAVTSVMNDNKISSLSIGGSTINIGGGEGRSGGATDANTMRMLQQMIDAKMSETVKKEMRPGGLLNRSGK